MGHRINSGDADVQKMFAKPRKQREAVIFDGRKRAHKNKGYKTVQPNTLEAVKKELSFDE